MTKLVDNERAKLLAGALDRASTAVFTVGIVTPVVSYFFNLQNIRDTLRTVSASWLPDGVVAWRRR